MKIKLLIPAFMMALAFIFNACSSDNPWSDVAITFKPPTTMEGLVIKSGELIFTNVSTGIRDTLSYTLNMDVNLINGLYNVTFIGEGTYTDVTRVSTKTVRVQGAKQNVRITSGVFDLNMEIFILGYEESNFVIAEVYGVGTYINQTTSQYNGDQYFRIHNNSSDTLYADSLIIMESKFLTVTKYDYTPNIMDEAMTVQVLAMIPGSGKDYPVAPGKSIIVCDNAIDHRTANSNSFDLSGADFEWYTSSTATSTTDVDNPEVTNLSMLFNYTKTIWILHKQGSKSYAIGKLKDIDSDTYLKNYTYDYTYIMANGKESSVQTEYKFPNEWIFDAVNIGAKSKYVWSLVHVSLDMGFTYYGENTTLSENIGKGVRRKETYSDDERVFYQDTNNSTLDFIPSVTPSLASK